MRRGFRVANSEIGTADQHLASYRGHQTVGLGAMIARGWIGVEVRRGWIAELWGGLVQTRLTRRICCVGGRMFRLRSDALVKVE